MTKPGRIDISRSGGGMVHIYFIRNIKNSSNVGWGYQGGTIPHFHGFNFTVITETHKVDLIWIINAQTRFRGISVLRRRRVFRDSAQSISPGQTIFLLIQFPFFSSFTLMIFLIGDICSEVVKWDMCKNGHFSGEVKKFIQFAKTGDL